MPQTDDIAERLRRTEKRKTWFATNRTAPPIESEYDALINPDGPEAADEIERLREENAWRPIESAPRDGTAILIAAHPGSYWRMDVAFWFYGDWACCEPCHGDPYEWQPTHWRPLPSPPSVGELYT